jgi:hypothetical protein
MKQPSRRSRSSSKARARSPGKTRTRSHATPKDAPPPRAPAKKAQKRPVRSVAKPAKTAHAAPHVHAHARTLSFGARADRPDTRDHKYGSPGDDIPARVDNRGDVVRVFDQRPEGACTGMAVCAAAELLHKRATQRNVALSPRWAYRRAREADPWPGEQYESSTTRAALEAWQKNGICEEAYWRFAAYAHPPQAPFDLVGWEGRPAPGADVNARNYRLLDYRRCDTFFDVKHSIHRHGVVVAGGRTHSGWELWDGQDEIVFAAGVHPGPDHAFLLVGYDENAAVFHVLSSWGTGWGKGGFAKWSYADARQNLGDMWAVRIPH